MKLLKAVSLTILLCALAVAACTTSYMRGLEDGKNGVIAACSFYHKYGIDGTMSMTCSGAVKEQDLIDQVVQHASEFTHKPLERSKKHAK